MKDIEQENWYVLQTGKGQECEGAALIRRAIPQELYTLCSIPRKAKLFRHGGVCYPVEDIMFPGYILIQSQEPGRLHKELRKSREFPQFPVFGKDNMGEDELVPVSIQDLSFLQGACGAKLQAVMGITDIMLGDDRKILEARGILERYLDQIVKLNLHKRFAVAEIPLFNRRQQIFFGIRLAEDKYCTA